MQRTQFFLWSLVALGCAGRSLDVGPGSGSLGVNTSGAGSAATGVGGTGSAGAYSALPASDCTVTTPLPSWPDPSACVVASDTSGGASSLIGTWDGYVENAQPPWDQMKLTIKGASINGGVCGTLVVGAGPAPAPATDPNVGYPPDADQNGYGAAPGVVSGSALTLLKGTTDGTRVRFSVAQAQAYQSWCQLQSSFNNNGNPLCGCLPAFSMAERSTAKTGTCRIGTASLTLTVNCEKLQICSFSGALICACNATGCDASTSDSGDFDLRFTADKAEGSTTLSAPARTVFTRAK